MLTRSSPQLEIFTTSESVLLSMDKLEVSIWIIRFFSFWFFSPNFTFYWPVITCVSRKGCFKNDRFGWKLSFIPTVFKSLSLTTWLLERKSRIFYRTIFGNCYYVYLKVAKSCDCLFKSAIISGCMAIVSSFRFNNGSGSRYNYFCVSFICSKVLFVWRIEVPSFV